MVLIKLFAIAIVNSYLLSGFTVIFKVMVVVMVDSFIIVIITVIIVKHFFKVNLIHPEIIKTKSHYSPSI